MKKSVKKTLFVAVLTMLSGIASALDTTWTDFTGSSPYSANTLSSDFSAATYTDAASIASSPADPNNPSGNFSFHFHSNGNFVFTLTPNGPVDLSSLVFDLDNNNADTLSFTYSVTGGGSGVLSSFDISGDTGSWTALTLNLTGIVDTTGGTITISGNTDSGGARIGNYDLASTPEPSSFVLAGMASTALLALRRRRRR